MIKFILPILFIATPAIAASPADIEACEQINATKFEATEILWEARMNGWTDLAIKAQTLIQDATEAQEICYDLGIY